VDVEVQTYKEKLIFKHIQALQRLCNSFW